MDKRSKPDPDPAKPRPQPAPGQREDRRDNQGSKRDPRPLGDDPETEGGDNSSLPEGSAGSRTMGASAAQAADAPQTPDKRGTGSAKPSNVRRDRKR